MKFFALCVAIFVSGVLLFQCDSQNRQAVDGDESQFVPFSVVETGDNVIDPPQDVDPFYKKYITANGVVIVGSEKVSDAALLAARKTILHLTSKRPDVHEAILQHHPRISIMAHDETASELPEYGPNSDGQWGLGQMPGSPTTLVWEKGICYEGNPDYISNFLLHEFVHDVHNLGMLATDPEVIDEIYAAFLSAVENGTFIPPADEPLEDIMPLDAYVDDEYFTFRVNAYYDLNEYFPGPWMHYDIGEQGPRSGTREELRQIDPAIYEIIERYFPESLNNLGQVCK